MPQKVAVCRAGESIICRYKENHPDLPLLVCTWKPGENRRCRDREEVTLEVK